MNKGKVLFKKHKINRRYVTMVTIMVALFILFQLVSNFAQYLINKEQKLSVMEDIDYDKLLSIEQEKKANKRQPAANYLIIGQKGDTVAKLIAMQLKNLGEASIQAGDLSADWGDSKGIFLCKETYPQAEIEQMMLALERNIPLFFAVMPNETVMQEETMQQLLGIREYSGTKKYRGIRFIEDFFISDMLEDEKISVTVDKVILGQGTKTYAYSLMSQKENQRLANEELPPIIWRSMYLPPGASQGTPVFCINAPELMESVTGYGILTAVLSELEADYLYPVINAYCYFIKDFPYLDNFTNDKLEALYSRDAIGVQQDVLFPAITGYCEKYALRTTYFSAASERLLHSQGKRETYYLKEIRTQTSELASYDEQKNIMYADEHLLRCDSWTPDFDFQYDPKTVHVPIIQDGAAYTRKSDLTIEAAKTALGFMSIYTDMEDVVNIDSDSNWVDISKKLDVLFAVHLKTMGYLERMSVSDCAKRIKLYQNQQLQTEKTPDGMKLTIHYFGGAAYYILKTDHKIKEIRNGSFLEIGNKRYLIAAAADQVEIIYQ